MQHIHIRPYESGTMIPLCGLDPATDKLRRLFKLSISFFQVLCTKEASSIKWLYFLLSNQQCIIAKVRLLEVRIAEKQQKCQQQFMRLTLRLQEESFQLSERERSLLSTNIENTKRLTAALETLTLRLQSPKEQIEKLKMLRLKKIARFSKKNQQLRLDLHTALVNARVKHVNESMLTHILAYLFSFANTETIESLNIQHTDNAQKKIQALVLEMAPMTLQTLLLSVLIAPGLWRRLKSLPTVDIATALLPVLVAFFQEFDSFRKSHTGLISGIETLKIRIKHIEQCYAHSVITSKVEDMMDEDLQTLYQAQSSISNPRFGF